MRTILFAPLLLAAACNVDNDPANDHVSVNYDEERIENTAADAARTAERVGAGIGNIASSTGRAIKNEVGDIDVDVDVRRNRDEADQAHTRNNAKPEP